METVMNTQDRRTADRLKSALENVGVAVRRTQLYDLMAAARGLRNRELLKRPYVMPDAPDLETLASVATRICPDEVDAVVTCAAAVSVPAPLECSVGGGWRGTTFAITFDEIHDVDAFLEGPRGKAGLEVVARNMYHSAFYLDRSDGGLDLKQGNELAESILATSEHCERYEALEEAYGSAREAYHSVSEQSDEIDSALSALGELAADVGADFDEQDWREALEIALAEHLEEKDDSSVEDMIQSGDRAEILFLLAPRYASMEDAMITTEYGSSEAAAANVDHPLQFALSRLGYGVGEFRRFSGNAKEARQGLDPTLQPLPRTLATPGEIMTIMENASSSYFFLAFYVQVPISELLVLDTTRPLVLRNARLSAHGPINGTHFDGSPIAEVTLRPEDGTLIAARSSPSDICGYVNSYFHGSVANAADEVGEVVEMRVACDDQYPLAFAA
jgi:hypothetical protein